MKKISLLLFIIVLIPTASGKFLNESGSWEASTPFRVKLGSEHMEQVILEEWPNVEDRNEFQIEDFDINVKVSDIEIPVALEDITGVAYYQMTPPERDASTLEWETRSRSLRVDLAIGSISVDTVIRRQVASGVIVSSRLQSTCKDVRLTSALGAEIFTRVGLTLENNKFKFHNLESEVDWPGNTWSVNHLACRGLSRGFDRKVRQEVLAYLERPKQEIQAELSKSIQGFLDGWGDSITNIMLSPLNSDKQKGSLHLLTEIEQLSVTDDGQIINEGRMKAQVTQSFLKEDTVINFNDPLGSMLTFENKTTMQIPVKFLRYAIMAHQIAGSFNETIHTYEFEYFQDLVKNKRRLLKAVFPDLLKYPKDTDFLFHTFAPSPPSIRNLKTGRNKGEIIGDIYMSVLIGMEVPIKGRYISYVQFRAKLSGEVKLYVEDGKFAMKFNDVDVDLKYRWNESYVETYRPNEKIRASTVASFIESHVKRKIIYLNLPDWFSKNESSPSGFYIENKDLYLVW